MKQPALFAVLAAVCAACPDRLPAQDLTASLPAADRLETAAPQSSGLAAPRLAPPGLPRLPGELVIPVQNPATLRMAQELGSVPGAAAAPGADPGLAGWARRPWPGQMTTALALLAAGRVAAAEGALARRGALDRESDCYSPALRAGQRVKEDRAALLEVVASEVGANPACACEIVKAVLLAAEADVATVAQVVEAAILAAPETMRIVAQCAIAVSPGSLARVQAVLARLDPNGGDAAGSSAKDAKDAKGSLAKGGLPRVTANPLDLPPPMIPPLIVVPVTDPTGNRYLLGKAGGGAR